MIFIKVSLSEEIDKKVGLSEENDIKDNISEQIETVIALYTMINEQ